MLVDGSLDTYNNGKTPDVSNRIWMPLYWGDYHQKTQHLTTYQHGAYFLLLGSYWMTGRAIDPQDVESITKANAIGLLEVQRVIDRFFCLQSDGLLHNKRMDRELAKAEKISQVRVKAGKKGGSKRKANAIANDKQLPTQSQSQSEDTKVSITPISPKPTKAKRDAIPSRSLEEFLQTIGGEPAEWREYTSTLGWSNEWHCRSVSSFSRYWNSPDAKGGGRKKDWGSTFYNFADRPTSQERPGSGRHDSKQAAVANSVLAERLGKEGMAGGGGAGTDKGASCPDEGCYGDNLPALETYQITG